MSSGRTITRDLAAGLDGVGLLYASEGIADVFKRLDAFDVGFQRLAARAGARAGDGVGRGGDGGLDRHLFRLVMVRGDDVNHIGRHAVAFGDVCADLGVRAFYLVAHRLADVVQHRAHLGELDVGAQFGGQHGGDVRGLHRVGELILAVAGAVFQAAQQLHQFGMQHLQADFDHRLLTGLFDRLLDFLLCLFDLFLDASRVDAAILHQPARA